MLSVHPIEVAQAGLTEDEALWAVLWTQGISEEGGARMKTYHYGTKVVGTLYNLFTICLWHQGCGTGGRCGDFSRAVSRDNGGRGNHQKQLIDQATSAAAARMRDEVLEVARKLTQQQVIGAMQAAAANRGALSGVAWVA